MYDPIQYRQYDPHPEVTPDQKFIGRILSLFQFALLAVGGYVGWKSATPHIAKLAEFFGIPLGQINYDFTIPVLEKTLHINGDFVCRGVGISAGLLVALISGGILEVILRHCKLIPNPIPRGRDEIVEPLPEDFPQIEPDDPLALYEADANTDDAFAATLEAIKKNPKEFFNKIKFYFIHTCLLREGFEVRIRCRNAFLYQALRQKMPVSTNMNTEISNIKSGKTIIREVKVFSSPQITIESNGTVSWVQPPNTGQWLMRCRSEDDQLSLTFRPQMVVCVIWSIIVAGIGLTVFSGSVIIVLIAAVLLSVVLIIASKEQEKMQTFVTLHLKKIEAAYADYAKKEKTRR